MSLIIAKKEKDKIIIGADSISVRGREIDYIDDKITKINIFNHTIYIGACGYANITKYIQEHILDVIDVLNYSTNKKQTIIKAITTLIINYKNLICYDFKNINEEILLFSLVWVDDCGDMFEVVHDNNHCYVDILMPINNIIVAGVGVDFAKGALYSGSNVEDALNLVDKHNTNVGGEKHIYELLINK